MTYRKLFFSTAFLFGFVAFTLNQVSADHHRNHHKDRHQGMCSSYSCEEDGHHMMEGLNLTAEQEKQIKKIHADYHEKLKKQKAAVKEAQEQLREAMQSNASDNTLRNRHNQLIKLKVDYQKTKFEKRLAMRTIFTPEQRKQHQGLKGHYKECCVEGCSGCE